LKAFYAEMNHVERHVLPGEGEFCTYKVVSLVEKLSLCRARLLHGDEKAEIATTLKTRPELVNLYVTPSGS